MINNALGKVILTVCRTDECVDGALASEGFLPLTQEGQGLQVSSEVKNKAQLSVMHF